MALTRRKTEVVAFDDRGKVVKISVAAVESKGRALLGDDVKVVAKLGGTAAICAGLWRQ